jgi:hypothetical protein
MRCAIAASAGICALLATPIPVDAAGAAATPYAEVDADRSLQFPQDYGSHPDYRTEWWYVTGWLMTPRGESLGFQVTFFRTRPRVFEQNPSAFTPRQLIIAHAALSDPKRGRLWQGQRIERAGFGLAEALAGNTDVWVEQWSLKHSGGTYTTAVTAEDFGFALQFSEVQAPLLNGNAGVSRKGPEARSASYYYSVPHLKVAGTIVRRIRSAVKRGSTMNGRATTSTAKPSAGIGLASIWMMAARSWRFESAACMATRAGAAVRSRQRMAMCKFSTPATCASRPGAPGLRRARASSTRCSGTSRRDRANSISSRCSTIKRTTRVCRRAQFIGKVRCARSRRANSSGAGISS